jgi:WD40 repeat protein
LVQLTAALTVIVGIVLIWMIFKAIFSDTPEDNSGQLSVHTEFVPAFELRVEHSEPIQMIAVAEHAPYAASADRTGLVCLWDLEQRRLVDRFPHPAPVADLCLSASGKRLAILSHEGVLLHDLQPARSEPRLVANVSAPTCLQAGDSADSIWIWTSSSQQLLLRSVDEGMQSSLQNSPSWRFFEVARANGRSAVAGWNAQAARWQLALFNQANQHESTYNVPQVFALAVDPHSASVVLGCYGPQGGVQVGRMGETPQPIKDVETDQLFYNDVAFSADGNYLFCVSRFLQEGTGAGDAVLRAWKTDSLQTAPVQTRLTGYPIDASAFGMHAHVLLVASGNRLLAWNTPGAPIP